jgi:hypothetical protein
VQYLLLKCPLIDMCESQAAASHISLLALSQVIALAIPSSLSAGVLRSPSKI